MTTPLLCKWDGEQFIPLPYFAKRAAREFVVGETYNMAELQLRSMNSHRHFFACVNEAWNNLPDEEQERFPTPDDLRKWALTFTSHCDVKHYQAGSNQEALRVARVLRESHDYCRVEVNGRLVNYYVPHSQSLKNMGARTFQVSKDAVFDVLARKLSVTVEELEEAGRRAA